MEVLTSVTSHLIDTLSSAVGNEEKEDIIFEHIKTAEKLKCLVDEFPSALDWFNTSQPLSSSFLYGKIVVLDFFTYCCINCLHIIPHLRQLEENFSIADGLVVVGVHSAKFDNEKDSQNILLALKRYNISHPVVNDKNCFLWNRLHISCWPTLLILGPQRQAIFALVGEGHRDELLLFVKVALKFYNNSISSHLLPVVSHGEIVTSSLLSFPGKITRWKNTFAISDSGNHRVLIITEDGEIKFKVGGRIPGFKDGSFETARFNSPQGLVFYDSNTVYVADTENHAIRLINLVALKVTTVVGTGQQGVDIVGGKIGILQEISSPWDVCIVPCSDVEIHSTGFSVPSDTSMPKGSLIPPSLPSSSSRSVVSPPPPPLPPTLPPPPPLPFYTPSPPPSFSAKNSKKDFSSSKVLLIAAAGTHQIWAYFIDGCLWWKGKRYEKNTCVAVAGSGKEENRNNRYPMMASFAQPSGLSYSPELKCVFIADSESSSIRKLSLTDGKVNHVVGGARAPDDLFCYGDVDGKSYDAKLQHPLGIAWISKGKTLFVCDTYNHKIKKINTVDGKCSSVNTTPALFGEPSGCCSNETEDALYVSDTNNNCIQVISLTEESVKKLDIKEQPQQAVDAPPKDVWEDEICVSTEGGTLALNVNLTPQEVHGKWRLCADASKIKVDRLEGKLDSNGVNLVLNVLPSKEDFVFHVLFDLVICEIETCTFKKSTLKLHVKKTEAGEKSVIYRLKKPLAVSAEVRFPIDGAVQTIRRLLPGGTLLRLKKADLDREVAKHGTMPYPDTRDSARADPLTPQLFVATKGQTPTVNTLIFSRTRKPKNLRPRPIVLESAFETLRRLNLKPRWSEKFDSCTRLRDLKSLDRYKLSWGEMQVSKSRRFHTEKYPKEPEKRLAIRNFRENYLKEPFAFHDFSAKLANNLRRVRQVQKYTINL